MSGRTRSLPTTARSLPEWIGRTSDTPVPRRVRWRVFNRVGRRCQGKCKRELSGGDKFICDHVLALVNGGENRESNLQILCEWCAPEKDAADVKAKAKVYRQGSRQFRGFREGHRPVPGSRDSGIRGRMDGTIEAWPS